MKPTVQEDERERDMETNLDGRWDREEVAVAAAAWGWGPDLGPPWPDLPPATSQHLCAASAGAPRRRSGRKEEDGGGRIYTAKARRRAGKVRRRPERRAGKADPARGRR